MTITCDRKRQVSFSGNYYDDGQRVLVPWDSPVAGIGDLRGKRVCIGARDDIDRDLAGQGHAAVCRRQLDGLPGRTATRRGGRRLHDRGAAGGVAGAGRRY
ncbi:hypothetical protein ACU686_13705 [Yinghuangia aomiensis]